MAAAEAATFTSRGAGLAALTIFRGKSRRRLCKSCGAINLRESGVFSKGAPLPIQNDIRCANPFMRYARRFLRSRAGNVSALTAILILPLAALLGMATEGGSWFLITRAMQNAADSAVVAAATNGGNDSGGSIDYQNEGKAIANSYGFTNGASKATVAVSAPKTYASVTACVSSPCYRVDITKTVPLYLAELIGYNGNVAVGSARGQQLSAVALATLKTVNAAFCLTALGTGTAITANGVPSSAIACNIQSNGDANCNGHSLTSGWSDTVGNSNSCGSKQHTGVTAATDPYASLAPNIPPNPCGSTYHLEPIKKKDDPLPPSNQWSTNSLPTNPVCGDYQLQNDITLSTGGTLVIENGNLDLNGHTLTTSSGVGLTIVLTGTNSPSYSHGIEGGGTLNVSSPTSGTWSGMAVYQDPNVAPQTLTYTGNTPTWDISGIVYLPKTNLTASGAVNKSSNGFSCFTLVVNTLTISGTGDLFYANAQAQCAQQGVNSPTNKAYVVGALVY
jgi:Flp pilus assembly protein TadG